MHLTPHEIDQRARLVKEACSWNRTPYRHQADIKGAGVDCGMLLVRAFVDTGLVPAFDPRPYEDDWYLHRGEEKYLGFVLDRIAQVEHPLFGDVVVFKYGRTYSHGGIVVSWPYVLHASAPAKSVLVENIEQSPYAKYPRLFYSYWARSARG